MKVPRSVDEMVVALRLQLALLDHNRIAVVRERRNEYIGEVANKLRLLAVDFGRNNKGLLTELMRRAEIFPRVFHNGPPGLMNSPGVPLPESRTLEEYMSELAFGIRTPSGEFAEFTKAQIVRAVAEKMGGAHQDWDIPERESAAFEARIFLDSMQMAEAELMMIAATVIRVGDRFLTEYHHKTHARSGERLND